MLLRVAAGLASGVGTRLLGLLAGVALFRALPPAELGRYALALTTAGVAGTLANAGTAPWLTREVARRTASDGRAAAGYARRQLRPVRLVLALAGAMLVALPALVAPGWLGRLLPPLAGLLLFTAALAQVELGTLEGLGAAGSLAALGLLRALASAVATLGLVLSRRATPALLLLGVVAAELLRWLLAYRRRVTVERSWDQAAGSDGPPDSSDVTVRPSPALSASLAMALVALLPALYFQLDVFFLNAWHGPRAVALYEAPNGLLDASWLVSSAWNVVLLPALAGGASVALVAQAQRSLAAVGLALALLFAARGGDLLGTLYGPTYAAAGPAAAILLCTAPLVFFSTPLAAALLAHGRERPIAGLLMGCFALNLTLNVLLIQPLAVAGAALATTLTELAAATGYAVLAAAAGLLPNPWRTHRAPVLATGLAALLLLAARPLPLAAALALAGAGYLLALWRPGRLLPC